MKASWTIPILVATTLAGCATTTSTIGDGTFQKRRLNTGWHVDLGLRHQSRSTERVARMEPLAPASLVARSAPTLDLLASSRPITLPLHERAPHKPFVQRSEKGHVAVSLDTHQATPEHAVHAPEESLGKWNPWAVPAFALALGTVAYAILGTSEIIVVLAVIATILLASVAVRKGRTNEWKGKGFAIAALMIGVLAGLITMIALIAG